jgi:hypothetical protein
VFKRPVHTVYVADIEDGDWRPIIENEDSMEIIRFDIFYLLSLFINAPTGPAAIVCISLYESIVCICPYLVIC